MQQLKELLKKLPGLVYLVKLFRKYVIDVIKYKKALARIKKTKLKIIRRHTDNPEKKIVVAFIIQYLQSWNHLKPVYEKLKNNSNEFEVLLLCVPSQLNAEFVLEPDRIDMNKQNDVYIYLKNKGYNCINAYHNGKWYDLESVQPDYVFHSRPYNIFMPEEYKSPKISDYALICNILYGVSLFKNDSLMNSDFYKDVYCYFANVKSEAEKFKRKFQKGVFAGIQKSYPFGTTALAQMLRCKSKKRNNGFKKTVLWAPRWTTDPNAGGSNFFNYVNVIKGLIEEFQDVMFIIRPHPLLFSNFVKTGEMTEREVVEFKTYCYNKHNVSLDESKEYADTFWQTDFLISDSSSIIVEYYVTGKPMIFCSTKNIPPYEDYVYEMLEQSYVVDNYQQLIAAFNQLYVGDDYKINGRKNSILNIFGNVDEGDTKIVEFLKNEIKGD